MVCALNAQIIIIDLKNTSKNSLWCDNVTLCSWRYHLNEVERMSNSKDSIIQNINRYLNLRRFSNDSMFNRQLEDVQNWQRQRMANRLEKTIKVADKLFSDLGLIDIVFEFNAVSAELDEALTEQIFEQMQADEVDGDIYRQASIALGNKDKRFLQLKLIRQSIQSLVRKS